MHIILQFFTYIILTFWLILSSFYLNLNENKDPYSYSHDIQNLKVTDVIYEGKHNFKVYQRAVALVYRYRDTSKQELLAANNIQEYVPFLVNNAIKEKADIPMHLQCELKMYYFPPKELVSKKSFLNENNYYINGFYCESDKETGILTRSLTIKLKEGELYQPAIDSLYNNYPLKFRGKISYMPYYFQWEVKTTKPKEIIEVAEEILALGFIEEVKIQIHPCVYPDLRE